jgi:NAD dependent epimerase/dehydratase
MAKILVTGAGGFIGSHLVEYLVEQGHQVRAFVRYNSCNYWGWLDDSKKLSEVEIFSGDIRDYDSVFESVKGIDYIFHLAALIGIPYSYYSPLAYIKTNIEGTYNILQAARKLNTQRVIHTSTSEVYGTAQTVPINESHPINPQSPYSATKSSADYLAKTFYLSFDLPVTIIRPFNTFGPRQSARAVIPTIITQALQNKEEINLGNIDSSRDFTFVLDTVKGMYQNGLHQDTIGEIVNLGTNHEITIANLVSLISSLTNTKIKIKVDNKRIRPEKSEVHRLVCDFSKAKKLTGWKPTYTFEDGLRKTIEWISINSNIYKEGIYNV